MSRKPKQDAAGTSVALPEQTRIQIGRRLGASLKRKGASQAAAGRVALVTRAAVNNWIMGRNLPELAQLHRMAVEYGLSLDYILLGSIYTPETLDLARRIADMPCSQREALRDIFAEAADSKKHTL